ncbi:GtrA family protein [Yoonia sp.]|uniref:GtrA family protein n=1 Tax=Yoonia sp. TaxID=2212373 RepID=UPI002DFDD465|nr:GtrA family protein [Yoonia sp.]
MRSELIAQVLRFGAVGGVGFVVDGGLLWLLIGLEYNPYLARALSFPVAVIVTWALNRNWTFRATRDASRKGQFRRYFGVQIMGSLTNYLVYSAVIGVFGTASLTIFAGFALGSFVGSLLNFIGARHVAFRV